MALRIQNNVEAFNAHRNLASTVWSSAIRARVTSRDIARMVGRARPGFNANRRAQGPPVQRSVPRWGYVGP